MELFQVLFVINVRWLLLVTAELVIALADPNTYNIVEPCCTNYMNIG